jgi:hypothetical protein
MPDSDPIYAPVATPRELRPDPEAVAHASTVRREGFVVLEHVLSPEEVAAMRAALRGLRAHGTVSDDTLAAGVSGAISFEPQTHHERRGLARVRDRMMDRDPCVPP